VKGPQTSINRLELFRDIEEVPRRSREAIEPRHYDNISRAELVQHPDQLRPAPLGTGDLLFINPGAAGRLERGSLNREILIVGRNAGVPYEHGRSSVSQKSSRNYSLSRQIFATGKSQPLPHPRTLSQNS
jgi:hypothetical protein